MLVDELYDFRNELLKDGISLFHCKERFIQKGIDFYYNGPLWQTFIEEVCEFVKGMIESGDTRKSAHKVLSVFIEQIQNIMKYSAEEKKNLGKGTKRKSGLIVIGRIQGKTYIMSGNLITKEQKEGLSERLNKIKKMDKDELKQYFKEQIKSEPEDDFQSAGLGLIDIARKASEPVEFAFEQVNEEFFYFAIKVFI